MWLHLFFSSLFLLLNFADINWLNLRKIYTTTAIIYLNFRLIVHNKELHIHLFNSVPVSKIFKVFDFGGKLSALFGFYADLLRFSVVGSPIISPQWCDAQCDAMMRVMRWAIKNVGSHVKNLSLRKCQETQNVDRETDRRDNGHWSIYWINFLRGQKRLTNDL